MHVRSQPNILAVILQRFASHLTFTKIALVILVAWCSVPRTADATELWLSAVDPVVRAARKWDASVDYMDLFRPDAPWPTVAKQLRVFKIGPGFALQGQKEDLKQIFAELQRRHIALAVEMALLTHSDHCYQKTEAYGEPGLVERMLSRIKRLGGDLKYIAMDEPFYYGHQYAGSDACKLSATQLAKDVAPNVAIAKRIFPGVQIGDIEVVYADRQWNAEIVEWMDAYRAATGEPLAFLHADVAWSELGMGNLVPLARDLKQRKIPLGIIYNARSDVATDLEWTSSAIDHAVEIESVLNVHPEMAIFQTWTKSPMHVLPEDSPDTLMNVALQYMRPASSLHLTRTGSEVAGVLQSEHGKPVANASVTLTAVDVGARLGPLPRHMEGSVPPGATTAVIGIRVGMEGSCVCAGATGAIVGGIHYKEKGTGKPPQDISPVSVPIQGAPTSVRTIELVPGKTLAPNLKEFAVTAGASYSLDTSIAATAAAEHAGYVMIVFLDASGKGLRRDKIWFGPSRQSLGMVQTDVQGRFHLALPETVALSQPEIRAEYGGSTALRKGLAVLSSPLGSLNASLPAMEPTLTASASPVTMLFMRQDFSTMFADEPITPAFQRQWEQTSQRLQVAYFSGGAILKMSDVELARIVRDLSKRHIRLGLEILATNWFHEPVCGQGVEGYIDPGSANQVVAKVLKAGGRINQVGMDEPLWFGHFYSGKNACRSTIPDLARRVAVIIKIYTAAFPGLVVGDVEPFPAVSNQPGWQEQFASWVKQFKLATGTDLNFLRLDFNWGDPQLNTGPSRQTRNPAAIAALAQQTAAVARKSGLLVGVIVNGGGPPHARSDAEWIQQARMHSHALRARGVRFDHWLFESWDTFPERTLPDTDPNTLSSLILIGDRP